MVFCPESDSILFVGSPFLDGLDGLTGRGLFISDIPLHDATRDVILVGEQARAQVSYTSLSTYLCMREIILPYSDYEHPLASVEMGIVYPDSGHDVGKY